MQNLAVFCSIPWFLRNSFCVCLMSSPASPFLVRLSNNCSPKFTFYTSSAILLSVFAQRLTLQPIHIKKKTHNIFICFFFRRRHAQNASTSHSNGVSTYIHFAVFCLFVFLPRGFALTYHSYPAATFVTCINEVRVVRSQFCK